MPGLNNLTDAEEVRLLDLSLLNTDKLALMAVLGTDSASGTEVAAGTSYAAQTLTFASASTTSGASTKATSALLTFSGLPATEIQGWEVRASGGTRKWSGVWEAVNATAQDAGDTITAAAHGRANADKIVFQSEFTPAGLSANTTYFVVGATTNTFQVAATSGGSAIAITADATSIVYGRVYDIASGGQFTVASGALSLGLS